MKYTAALYMRLSKDDGHAESAGIESQRLLLREYAKREDISVFDEYVDDGYSGTCYNRPAFARMLEDIEEGRVNTVIVKDMSRLGRDYIATGELTEVYFPEHFVRFIAINDGYDSERGGDDMIPFRHVMNEMYARDISRKIRTALTAKMKSGQYIGSFAPYGYKKSADDKNRLVVDPESARTVKRIFDMRYGGYTTKDIARSLNTEGILIPLDYRRQKLGLEISRREWTQSGVCKILRNQVYIGNTVQGKSVKPSIRSKRTYPKGRDEWIVVKNTHPPIVSETVFRSVQSGR